MTKKSTFSALCMALACLIGSADASFVVDFDSGGPPAYTASGNATLVNADGPTGDYINLTPLAGGQTE